MPHFSLLCAHKDITPLPISPCPLSPGSLDHWMQRTRAGMAPGSEQCGRPACHRGDKALSFYHSFISQLLYNLSSGAFFGRLQSSLDWIRLMKSSAWLKNTFQRQQRCVLGHRGHFPKQVQSEANASTATTWPYGLWHHPTRVICYHSKPMSCS